MKRQLISNKRNSDLTNGQGGFWWNLQFSLNENTCLLDLLDLYGNTCMLELLDFLDLCENTCMLDLLDLCENTRMLDLHGNCVLDLLVVRFV